MDTFALCDGAEFSFLHNDLVSAQTLLQDAYNKAQNLQTRINQGSWTGKSQISMQAYMNLLLQYHGALIGKSDNPVQEAVETLNELMKHLDSFYDEYKEYQELERLP